MDKLSAAALHDPALIEAEKADHRVDSRKSILAFIPQNAVCAELGVFTGLFSEQILMKEPAVLHLVDPWYLAHGVNFPDWGPYNANGKLKTTTAFEAATARTEPFRDKTEVHIHMGYSTDWLQSVPDEYLDWVYVDSSHDEQATLDELYILEFKLKVNGIICGDDAWTDPANHHFGVFKAVQRFCNERPFEIFYLDTNAQWGIRRRTWSMI